MAESKTHTIRANDDTIEQFKAICANFPNADEAVKSLITAHEMAQARGVLVGQETAIKNFQAHADSIVMAYMSALDTTANAEERIRGEFRLQLDSKDKTIISLQEQLKTATETAAAAEKAAAEVVTAAEQDKAQTAAEVAAITAEKERAEQIAAAATAATEEARRTIDTLTARNNDLAAERDKLRAAAAERDNLREELAAARSELIAAKTAAEIAAAKAEKDMVQAVATARSEQQSKIDGLRDRLDKLRDELATTKDKLHEVTMERDRLGQERK